MNAEKFWSKVKIGPDCWEWTGAHNPEGYGGVYHNGKYVKAHRYAWELTFGVIPDGMCICHRCDNPPCVKPEHLFLGTKRDNLLDSYHKGRPHQGFSLLRGENHTQAKLTLDQVKSIRISQKSSKELSNEFSVSAREISHIQNGLRWRE